MKLVIGLILLMLGGSVFWVTTFGPLRDYDWNQIKPVAWLRIEARHGSGPALSELNDRLDRGALSARQSGRIIDDALHQQTLGYTSWNPDWGRFVEEAHRRGYASVQQWEGYGLNIIDGIQMEVRPTITRGDPLVIRIKYSKMTCSNLYDLRLSVIGNEFCVNDRNKNQGQLSRVISFKAMPSASKIGYTWYEAAFTEVWMEQLADGPYTLTLNLRAKLYLTHKSTPIATKTVALSDTFALLPAEKPSARAATLEQHRASVEAGIKPFSIDWVNSTGTILLGLGWSPSPIAVAFQVTARTPDGEIYDLGHFASPEESKSTSPIHVYNLRASSDLTPTKTLDLILTPSYDAAVATLDITEYWGDTIVFEDVPVQIEP
jgi:hypothetical protein